MTYVTKGMIGENVKNLQVALNRAMPFAAPIKTDGNFGPATLAKVLAFQKSVGLKQDGIVGPLTSKGLLAAAITVWAWNAAPVSSAR